MKRLVDVIASGCLLLVTGPVLLILACLVWLQDRQSPFYMAPRTSRGGGTFKIVKLRSMVIDADKTGVSSTAANDMRITAVGSVLRRFKLDELTQLWNVLVGEMSLVGPRPNIWIGGAELYTKEEIRLLSVRPGITDFASIVFSDEGSILADYDDADLAYNQLIRPWKSRLSLFYIDNANLWIDIRLIFLTIVAIFSRDAALTGISALLVSLGAPIDLVKVSHRTCELTPTPPPGAKDIVTLASRYTISPTGMGAPPLDVVTRT